VQRGGGSVRDSVADKALEAVQVTETLYSRRQVELERRRRRRFGHFITREELDRNPPRNSATCCVAFRGSAYIRAPRETWSCSNAEARSRAPVVRPCTSMACDWVRTRTLDLLANVNSLEAVEVYTSSGQAPVEFWSGGCGSLVLWTRTDAGRPAPKPQPEREPSPGR
jgi:hypothetical protein